MAPPPAGRSRGLRRAASAGSCARVPAPGTRARGSPPGRRSGSPGSAPPSGASRVASAEAPLRARLGERGAARGAQLAGRPVVPRWGRCHPRGAPRWGVGAPLASRRGTLQRPGLKLKPGSVSPAAAPHSHVCKWKWREGSQYGGKRPLRSGASSRSHRVSGQRLARARPDGPFRGAGPAPRDTGVCDPALPGETCTAHGGAT